MPPERLTLGEELFNKGLVDERYRRIRLRYPKTQIPCPARA